MTELKKCPCGKTPSALHVGGGVSSSWAWVCGDCCYNWAIEFRTVHHDWTSNESYENAVKYWNDSPRAEENKE